MIYMYGPNFQLWLAILKCIDCKKKEKRKKQDDTCQSTIRLILIWYVKMIGSLDECKCEERSWQKVTRIFCSAFSHQPSIICSVWLFYIGTNYQRVFLCQFLGLILDVWSWLALVGLTVWFVVVNLGLIWRDGCGVFFFKVREVVVNSNHPSLYLCISFVITCEHTRAKPFNKGA